MSDVFQWKRPGNETPCVGRKVMQRDCLGVVYPVEEEYFDETCFLMLPSHETVCQWVHANDLRPYPSEPIEQPK